MLLCFGKANYNSFTRPMPILILSYLVVEGPSSQEKLLDIFWPNQESKKPNKRLSENLRQIKNNTDIVIQNNNKIFSLEICSDVQDFDTAINKKEYQTAIELYGGEFLQGFEKTGYFPNSKELLSWLINTRERYQQKFLESLLGLGEELARAQQFDSAADLAMQALDLSTDIFSPTDGDYYRIYRLIIATGKQAKANKVQEQKSKFFGSDDTINLSQKEAREELAGLYSLPSQKYFIGRTKELKLLTEKLIDHRLIAITGFPGIGKTQLAVRLANRLRQNKQFPDGIFYTNLESESEFYESLKKALRQPAHISKAELINELAKKQILIILDSFTNGDLELLKQLKQKTAISIILIAEQLTTSFYIYKYQLKGLNDAGQNSEAEQYFNYLCTELNISIKQDKQLNKLLSLTGGHPAVLELVAIHSQTSPIADIINNYAQVWQQLIAQKPNLQKIPKEFCQILSQELKEKYWNLSLFQNSFSSRAAARVATLNSTDLSELTKNRLLYFDSITNSYSIPSLIKPYLIQKQNSIAAKKRYSSFILRSLDNTNKAEIHTDDVVAAWKIGLEYKLTTLLKDTALELNRYFNKNSQYSLGITLLQQAQDLFTDEVVFNAAEVILHYHSGNFAYAINTAKVADFSNLPTSILRRFYIAYGASLDNLGYFSKAKKVFKKDLKLYKKSTSKKANAHLNLAYILMQQGQYEKAKQNLDKAEEILHSTNKIDEQAWLTRAKGLFFYESMQYGLANIYFSKAVDLAEKLSLKRLYLLASYGLAKTYLAQNQISQASYYINLFLSSLDNNPSIWLKIKAHSLLGDLKLQQNDKTNSVKHYYQAFELALALGSIPGQLFVLNSLTRSLLAIETNIAKKLVGFLQAPSYYAKMSNIDQRTLENLISQYHLESLSEWSLLNMNELSMVLKKELPEQLLENISIKI